MLKAIEEFRTGGGTEVQVSEYVSSKHPHYAVNFFIGMPRSERNRENPTFLCATEQTFNHAGIWEGGIIDFGAQDEIKKMVMDAVLATARSMPEDYVGWVGIDVIIDEKSDRPLVVDLNARITGGLVICLLSSHFMEVRGLRFARMESFNYNGASGDIYELLQPMIEQGSVVVSAAMKVALEKNQAYLIYGGRSRDELKRIGYLIHERLTQNLS